MSLGLTLLCWRFRCRGGLVSRLHNVSIVQKQNEGKKIKQRMAEGMAMNGWML